MMLESLVSTASGNYAKQKEYASDDVAEPYVSRSQILPSASAKDNRISESDKDFSST